MTLLKPKKQKELVKIFNKKNTTVIKPIKKVKL